MNALFMKFHEDVGDELMLKERLAAGYGDTAISIVIERLVLQEPGCSLFSAYFVPYGGDAAVVTGPETSQAVVATGTIETYLSIIRKQCPAFAHIRTLPASGAFLSGPLDLDNRIYGFRVGAPGTMQGTAFNKHGGPDAGAIMDTEMLEVEYNSLAPAGIYGAVSGHQSSSLSGSAYRWSGFSVRMPARSVL
jgi:hypothetical protein